MNRRVLASGLAALAAVVWVPHWISGNTASSDAGGAGEALLKQHEESADAGALLDSVFGGSFAEVDAKSGQPTGDGDRLDSLERTLLAMESFLPTRAGESLDQLASQWASSGRSTDGELYLARGMAPEEAPMPNQGPAERSRGVGERSSIADFLAAHPLLAIATGPSRSRALFGNRMVAVGEELLSGALAVESIEPRRVVLKAAARSYVVDLAPLQAGASDSATSSGTTLLAPSANAEAPAHSAASAVQGTQAAPAAEKGDGTAGST